MHRVYVNLPYNYNYEYQGESCGPEALSREFGVEFEFICNAAQSRFNLSKLGQVGNKGDAHVVFLESEKDEIFFLLKSGFIKLNNIVVEDYLNKKRTEELGKMRFKT